MEKLAVNSLNKYRYMRLYCYHIIKDIVVIYLFTL